MCVELMAYSLFGIQQPCFSAPEVGLCKDIYSCVPVIDKFMKGTMRVIFGMWDCLPTSPPLSPMFRVFLFRFRFIRLFTLLAWQINSFPLDTYLINLPQIVIFDPASCRVSFDFRSCGFWWRLCSFSFLKFCRFDNKTRSTAHTEWNKACWACGG